MNHISPILEDPHRTLYTIARNMKSKSTGQYNKQQKNGFHNLQNNHPHGNQLVPFKPPNTSRFYFINPNGFHIDDDKGFQTLNIDARGFAEINMDTAKVAITHTLHKALRANSTIAHCNAHPAPSKQNTTTNQAAPSQSSEMT
jgi:hypothetical protein